jgi:hypothetical protein
MRIVCHSGYPKTSRDMTIPIIKFFSLANQ